MPRDARGAVISRFIRDAVVDTKDAIINRFIEATKPRERECTICHNRYVGTRIICGDPRCELGLKLRVAENRSMRPLDYVSTARKTLVTELTATGDRPPGEST